MPDSQPGSTAPVRILTLNCWGLKFVSKRRKERIDTIARRLSALKDHDIIALQEVWVEEDYEKIRESVAPNLPFAKRWYSGILAGPGLAVFSRWPIESSWIYRFPLNGRPSAFWRGDWYVGKAAGSCVILHPSGRKLEIVNAHLHAPYAQTGDAAYVCHRASQAWDMSNIVWRAMNSGHAIFVTGDLNARPQSVQLQLFEKKGMLSDAWLALHDAKGFTLASDIAKLTPEEQIELAGVTSDSRLNTWRAQYGIERAKRLDYIFFDATRTRVTDAHVCFAEPEPGIGSVSDHFGFEATFDIGAASYTNTPPRGNKTVELNELHNKLLDIIHDYLPTARRQASLRVAHFWVSVAIVIGIMVAVWWGAESNRAYVGFILICAAVAVSVTGLIDGLLGFLFGRNERRALAEFEAQVRLSQSHLNITY